MVDDAATRRGLTLVGARADLDLSEFDGDLSAVDVPILSGATGAVPADARLVSPTQIQTWASCPHAYFVRYLLGVNAIDEPDSQISINALDRGLVQHDVLDALHRDVLSGVLPQPTDTGWTDEHRHALERHFDEMCTEAERTGRTGRPATWASERARMHRDLLGWFRHDSDIIRANGVTILASEHRFPDRDADVPMQIVLDLSDRRQLPIHGSIDRLDRWADGRLIVTDHKTGKADTFKKLTETDPTLAGSAFQLPAYAAAALAFVGAADDPASTRIRAEYSMFDRGRYARLGIDFDDEVWSIVRSELSDVVDGIESGWFPQVPEAPGFRVYTPCVYCEPDELGTTDAFERWTAKRNDSRIARWFGDTDDDSENTDD